MFQRDAKGLDRILLTFFNSIGSLYGKIPFLSSIRADCGQYEDKQYIQALQLLQNDDRVKLLGLCNFDTQRMEEVLAAGINIVTNQVQVRIADDIYSSYLINGAVLLD